MQMRNVGLTPTSENQAEIALKSEGFTDIDFATLEMILGRETLNCKEIVVFEVSTIDESFDMKGIVSRKEYFRSGQLYYIIILCVLVEWLKNFC